MWAMRRAWAIVVVALAALAGCGGDGPQQQPTMTLDPHPPRAVAPGTTIEHHEDGRPRQAGDGWPPLRTASAAREACAAAPGTTGAVRAGCRRGLHRQGDRP
jgi:predicted small lipoprotein YifL